MTASLTVADGRTTLTLRYTAVNEGMQLVLENAARALYAEGLDWWEEPEPPPPYEQLSVAQKLGLINAYVRSAVLEKHRMWMVDEGEAAARATAEQQAAVDIEE